MDTAQLKRIADAMEEILRLVKEDQAQYKKEPEKNGVLGDAWEKREETAGDDSEDRAGHY